MCKTDCLGHQEVNCMQLIFLNSHSIISVIQSVLNTLSGSMDQTWPVCLVAEIPESHSATLKSHNHYWPNCLTYTPHNTHRAPLRVNNINWATDAVTSIVQYASAIQHVCVKSYRCRWCPGQKFSVSCPSLVCYTCSFVCND